MLRTLARAVLTAAFLCAVAGVVVAQNRNCMPADMLNNILSKEHSETVMATGTIGDGAAARFYVSPEKRTWTLVILLPDGNACLIAAGKAFDLVRQPEPTGDPS